MSNQSTLYDYSVDPIGVGATTAADLSRLVADIGNIADTFRDCRDLHRLREVGTRLQGMAGVVKTGAEKLLSREVVL